MGTVTNEDFGVPFVPSNHIHSWDGIAILVPKLEDLSETQILQWLGPLYPEKIGSIPVFECSTLSEFLVILGLFDPGSIILAHPVIAEQHFNSTSIKDLMYSCRIEYINGVERRILVTPVPQEVDWGLLEPALDRLEEIL